MKEPEITTEVQGKKNFATMFKRLSSVGQNNVALAINTSESTVSRLAAQAETIAHMLAAIGLKTVPVEFKCYPPEELNAIFLLAKRQLASINKAEELAWDEDAE